MSQPQAASPTAEPSRSPSPNDLAAGMLGDALQGRPGNHAESLAALTRAELHVGLVGDHARLAFWINVYNAGVRADLSRDPGRRERKFGFFAKNGLVIAGKRLTYNQIEHGMIRRSMFGLTLGYVSNPLPNKFEREFRLERRDPRIHFALNCGARSCPPVQVYEPGDIDRQLNLAMHAYLVDNSSFDAATRTVVAPRLLSWYRGDFDGTQGILRLLEDHEVIPATDSIRLKFGDYDWTALTVA